MRSKAASLSAVAFMAFLVAREAPGSVASDILSLTGGKHVKVVWSRQVGGGNGYDKPFGAGTYRLIGFDTATGSEFDILGGTGSYFRAKITHDGNTVVYNNGNDLYAVDWSGSNNRLLRNDAQLGCVSPNYIYIDNGANTNVYRITLANPGNRTQVYSGGVTSVWLTVSIDDAYLGSHFPWSGNGGLVNTSSGSLTEYGGGGGCWSSVSPDTLYRYARFDGAHRNWDVWNFDHSNERRVVLNNAPGINGWEIYHPRFAENDPGYFTMTGPYDQGAMGANNIGKGGPNVEVYLGKFNAGITSVTNWVKVTSNSSADFGPMAVVGSATSNDVRIDSFSASPTTIAQGETSTLSWATTYATSVSINQGIGTVGADGTRGVTPATTTTYTLTAQGTGGPVSRQVTVTVQTLRDPDNPSGTQAGLNVSYYALSSPGGLPDFGGLTPYKSSTATEINYPNTAGNFADSDRADNLGAVYTGYVEVSANGIYTFYTESDDGSALYIGATKVVDNDGLHGMAEKSGAIGLKAGRHALRVDFFEATGGCGLIVKYAGPGISGTAVVPGSALSHVATAAQLTSIQVTPSSATAQVSGTAQFTAYPKDQYGGAIAAVISWSVSGGGTMSPASSGSAVTEHGSTFTSTGGEGAFTVTASSGAVSGTATVTVTSGAGLHMKVNCGPNSYEVAGWERDDAYVTAGQDYTFPNTADTSGVANAAPADLYRTCRRDDHSYSFPSVLDGTYTVRIHFYDEYAGDTRAMDYTIEGVKVLDDFSIVAEVGTGKALVKEFAVDVSSAGGSGLQIVAEKDSGNDAFDCGIEIIGSSAQNSPPSVDAGTGGTVEIGSAAGLNATVTDDGLPSGTLTFQWTKQSGPGDVTFGNAAAEDTTATFSAAGSYVLRLTASDGDLSDYDDVTVTVVEPGAPAITLLSPNGGEVWYVGQTRHVEWESYNLDHASISYTTDGGVTARSITDTVVEGDAGWLRYPWTVPDEPSTQCLVYVSGYFGEAPTQSAAFFEIRRLTDSDGDQMDDAWETANFGDLTRDGTGDADGDGFTDLEEFLQGTDPNVSDKGGGGTGFSCFPGAQTAGVTATVLLLAALCLLNALLRKHA